MRTSRRFARGSAELARMIGPVLGVAMGLVTSACIDPPTSDVEQDLTAQRAVTTLDQIREGDLQTGAVCGGGTKRCFAHVQATPEGFVHAMATPAAAPAGFGATDLQTAYKIPTTVTGTPTVAIVDAYGYTTLESDLATYRTQYG